MNSVVDNNASSQDAGIRIEGPGSKNNTITTNNVVTGNGRHGIVLFRNPAAAGASNSMVQNNIIQNNRGEGLLVQSLNSTLTGNRVSGSVVMDLHDTKANCDNNAWHANTGATAAPACVLTP